MQIARKYGTYTIHFDVSEPVEKLCQTKGFDLHNLISNDWYWFTALLPELLDQDKDGMIDKEFGQIFSIQFYKAVAMDERPPRSVRDEREFDEAKVIAIDASITPMPRLRLHFKVLKA